jgi:hypothetical protein
MRFPSFEPVGEPYDPATDKNEKSGFAHIPEAARKKILRVLQGDLMKRGKDMPDELKHDTLNNVIAIEEEGAKDAFGGGELVTSENMHYSTPPESDDFMLNGNVTPANESNLEEDKKRA